MLAIGSVDPNLRPATPLLYLSGSTSVIEMPMGKDDVTQILRAAAQRFDHLAQFAC